ncbi:hypothetical protein JTE90_008092, partial [Oedothorax gibbosus]
PVQKQAIGSTFPSGSTNIAPPSRLPPDWVQDYKIPFDKLPQRLLRVLKEKERADPGSRRQYITIISKEIFTFCPRPGKANLKVVAQKSVQAFPIALVDEFCGEKLAGGYGSLLQSFISKFENLNRQSIFSSVKRKVNTSLDIDDPTKLVKKSDQYGCINWQPEMLPEGETEETQQNKREQLVHLSSLVSRDSVGEEAILLLEDTYCSQRKDINSLTGVKTLLMSWPLLFAEEGLLLHFKLLVGLDISSTFKTSFLRKGVVMEKYFLQNLKGKMKETIVRHPSGSTEVVLLLLMDHFQEKHDSLFIEVDSSSTVKDVESLNILPATPCLVICDNEHSHKSYMVAVDKKVVNETTPTFERAFYMLFASFFVFNIEYTETACSTLEFVQRCFLNINPDKGTKRGSKNPKKKTKTSIMDPKVLTLTQKLGAFEWC